MHKFFVTILLVLLTCGICFSQIKTIEDAQNEIKTFTDSNIFSVLYDETKYLTKAEISFEVLEEKDTLRKQFSKFEWQMTSLFAIKGIDAKPVRNVLCINSQSKTFVFSRENSLTILFSDSDVNFGEPNRLSEIKKGKANERLCWEVEQEIFYDFAKSEKTEFQLGTIKGQIRPDKMQIFKDYVKLLEVKNNLN